MLYRQFPDVLVDVALVLAVRHQGPREFRCGWRIKNRAQIVGLLFRGNGSPIEPMRDEGLFAAELGCANVHTGLVVDNAKRRDGKRLRPAQD